MQHHQAAYRGSQVLGVRGKFADRLGGSPKQTSVNDTLVLQGQRTKLVSIVTVGPGLTSASGVPALGPSVIDTFDYRIMEQ